MSGLVERQVPMIIALQLPFRTYGRQTGQGKRIWDDKLLSL